MDLYQPLFLPRPTVEPEHFASLRPPAYSGALVSGNQFGQQGGGQNLGGVNPGQFGGFPGNRYQPGAGAAGGPGFGGGLGFGGGQGQNLGVQGGALGIGGGGMLGGAPGGMAPGQANPRLTYEELQKRQQEKLAAKDDAKKTGSALAALDPSESVAGVAAAAEVGDHFQYTIDQKVTLPRQKSALLPIINDSIETTRVSIFNEAVHARFPLLGLKFKNTSGQHLMQGPITVYDGGNYAGDSRILDLQPNEERLLAYAIDLGTEVKAEGKSAPVQLTAVKVVKGIIHTTSKLRDTRTYLIRNRSAHDRVLLIEQPIRQDWKLVAPEKPAERSRDAYRFQLNVVAGKTARQDVVEEQICLEELSIARADDNAVRALLASTASSPRVKEALRKVLELRTQLAEAQRATARQEQMLKAITDDQQRLRANLREMPQTAAAYKRYLEKFDKQETEIENLQTRIKELRETEKQRQEACEEYLAALTVE
jgi:hypothetical protein